MNVVVISSGDRVRCTGTLTDKPGLDLQRGRGLDVVVPVAPFPGGYCVDLFGFVVEPQDRQDRPAHLPTAAPNMGELHETVPQQPAQVQPVEQYRQLKDGGLKTRGLFVFLAGPGLRQGAHGLGLLGHLYLRQGDKHDYGR